MKIRVILFSLLLLCQPSKVLLADGFFDSDFFDGMVFCGIGGGGALAVSLGSGNEILYGGIGCAGGIVTSMILSARYNSKIHPMYQRRIKELEDEVSEFRRIEAQNAANGNTRSRFSDRITKVVPGQVLPSGTVISPHLIEKPVLPGNSGRFWW
jgi:hypothetical protein